MGISVTRSVDRGTVAASTGAGQTFTNDIGADFLSVWINVTAVSGSTPTCVFRLQWSPDGGTTWVDWDTTNLQTASINSTTTATLRVGPGLATTANASRNDFVPGLVRVAYTIGGSTPSFTFSTWFTAVD